jgi:hypothetical protein
VFGFLREFYNGYPQEVIDILDFEEEKIDDAEKRYAWIIRKKYAKDFVKSGIILAKARQEEADV